MSKIGVIIAKEYREVVQKKSFIIGILLTPALIAAWSIVPSLLMMNSVTPVQEFVIVNFGEPELASEIAAGLSSIKNEDSATIFDIKSIETYSSTNDPAWLLRKPKLDSLVQQDSVKGALLIPSGALETESLTVISKSFDLKSIRRSERKISDVLATMRITRSRLGMDVDSLKSLTRSIDLTVVSPSGKSKSFFSVFLGVIILAMVIFMMAMGYGQMLMRSVIEEKTSRITEVMISSVTAFQMMLGKILGLGAAALTQIAAWAVMAISARVLFADTFANPSVQGAMAGIFNPIFLFFFVIYLILAFLLYTSLFAAVGSMCNTDKDAQNIVGPMTFLMVAPVMLAESMIGSPSPWMIAVSFIPFFTPTMMVMRISVAAPESFSLSDPVILHASIGVIVTSLFVLALIWVTSRIFRVGILMYGKRPTLPEIVRWVRRK